jgi:DMSO/TMAO reductase YedYZ molybdopterin-dependent catalytic subunit
MEEKTVLDPVGLVRRIPLKAHELVCPITAQSDLFVLAHIGVPRVDKAKWFMEVDGAVKHPFRLTYDDLKKFPKHEVESFHQCTGFPRRPDIATRRVANVVWSGIAVSDLLDRAGVKSSAQFLWVYGLDCGTFEGKDEQYVKDIPLYRIGGGSCLLAYEVNGEPLTAEHGFPVRLVVPGFYGTNSVKWVCRLEVAGTRHPGTFTRVLYNDPVVGNGLRPVWKAGPESLIVAPTDGSTLQMGHNQIWGWSWGYDPIVKVQVSCDGGKSWNDALTEVRRAWAWQRFSFDWNARSPGPHTLIARATDASGQTQPAQAARNAIHSISITVI